MPSFGTYTGSNGKVPRSMCGGRRLSLSFSPTCSSTHPCSIVSNTGENTVEHHRRVSAKRWVKPQPLSEKPRIEDVGDLADALVDGAVAGMEAAEDEEALVVVAVVVDVEALVEEVVLPNNDPLDHPRASMDRDEASSNANNKSERIFGDEEVLQHCMEFSFLASLSTLLTKKSICIAFESHFTTYTDFY